MKLSREELLDNIGCALRQLYVKDIYLIKNDSHELSLEGRMAIYLQSYFSLSVDTDYNRKERSEKKIHMSYSVDPGDECGYSAKPLKYEVEYRIDDQCFRPEMSLSMKEDAWITISLQSS